MDVDNENIVLSEIPVLKKKFICPHCEKEFKSKNGWKKHIEKFHPESDNESQLSYQLTEYENPQLKGNLGLPNISNDLHILRSELQNLLLNNPSLNIDEPVNTTSFEKINNMTPDELRARIFNAKRSLNNRLDHKISDGTLSFCNQIVGRLLGCVEELEEEIRNDEMLRDSTKELLSFNLLSKIPVNIKVAGLYSIDVASALNKKRVRNLNDNDIKDV